MTHDEFSALVGRLEQQNQRNPVGYKRKVILLALAANAYLAIMMALLVFLFAIACLSIVALKAFGVKIALVIGFFLWAVCKALWVKQLPPQGLQLNARQAPALFGMIKVLQRELKAPYFHEVLLTDDFNAGVVQIPRLGIFGWPRNYLLIGLPLMKSLTEEQFKAVLAHEFGHLAKAHSRFSNWVYTQRLRWEKLVRTLEAHQSNGSFLFKPFLQRFVPYFSAYSFPLARANEYEADAASVRLTSAQAAAEALTSVNVIGSYLHEKYWPDIYKKADDHPAPNFAPYSGITHGVIANVDTVAAQRWLDQALARKTTIGDTHPSLSDRLEAIGAKPLFRFPQPHETADRLLGDALGRVTNHLDQCWQSNIGASWEQRHKEVRQGRQRLAELNAKLRGQTELEPDEAYERAHLCESYADDAAGALEQLRVLYARVPDNSKVCFAYAHRLLLRDDEAGVALAQRAVELDHRATAAVCETMRDYCWRKGEEALAHDWQGKLIERRILEEAAVEERSKVELRNSFDTHRLPPQAIAKLRAQLDKIAGLNKAWLVRKRVQHFAEEPCYVLGFSVTFTYKLHGDKRKLEVQRAIVQAVDFPGEALIFCVEGKNSAIGRKVKSIKDAQIY